MRIGELAKQHHIDTRTIDYYTKLGLLTYEKESNSNKYRNYTKEAEKRLWKIQILRDMGIPLESSEGIIGIREILDDPSYFDNKKLDDYIVTLKQHRDEEIARYDQLIKRAENMRRSGYSFPSLFKILDGLSDAYDYSLNAEEVQAYIDSSSNILSLLTPENNDELKDVIYATLSKLRKEKDKGPKAEEVQSIIARFLDRVDRYKAFFVATALSEYGHPAFADIFSDFSEDPSEIELIQKGCAVCAKWIITAWEPEKILDFDTFRESFRDEIRELDELSKKIDEDAELSVSDDLIYLIDSFYSKYTRETFLSNYFPIIKSLLDGTKIHILDGEFGDGFSQYLGQSIYYYISKNYPQLVEDSE